MRSLPCGGDARSLALLESLLRLVQETGVVFVLTLRPEQSSPAQRVLKLARRHYADRYLEIGLAPLSGRQCDALACNLLRLDDLSYATLGALLRRAEGNPFFIEEVVRSLIDEGAVEYRGGRFRVTDKIDHVVLPGTIQEVIMTRIDRLPEKVRRVVQIASVIGRSFRRRILTAVVPEERELEWALGFLKKRQLIVQQKAHGEVEYVFKHALAQEAIYESILQNTRKELHAAVARAIETIFADRLPEFYGMLAYHFSRAEHIEQAESYLFKAGDEAARAAASSEALSYFQEASRHYLLMHGDGGDPAHKALLDVGKLESATAAGDRLEVRALATRARSSLRAALGNAGRVAIERTETYNLAGRLYWSLGDEKKALRWWERSIEEGERLAARPELARTHLEVGRRLAGSATLRGLDAALHLQRARDLFTELELSWDLEQLEPIERARGADAHRGDGRRSAVTLACA